MCQRASLDSRRCRRGGLIDCGSATAPAYLSPMRVDLATQCRESVRARETTPPRGRRAHSRDTRTSRPGQMGRREPQRQAGRPKSPSGRPARARYGPPPPLPRHGCLRRCEPVSPGGRTQPCTHAAGWEALPPKRHGVPTHRLDIRDAGCL